MRVSARLTDDARATMGWVAATLYLIGSALTVLCLLLPHSPQVDAGGFWAMAVATGLGALILFRYAGRLSPRSYQFVMLLASVTITASLYFNGERHGGPSAGNQVLYVWVALYSGYFFSRVAMTAQLAAIAALYAGALLVIDVGSVAVTRWLITVAMVSAAAAIVHALKLGNEELLTRLAHAARTDSLTGLANRQSFDERLQIELARARRAGRPVALVIADIDRFKEINDRFGHAVGDAALRVVSETARRESRSIDTVARIGGDEFAAILPDTDAEGARVFAERLRESVLASRGTEDAPLTLSLGVAESDAEGLTPDILSRSADEALYEAKRRGRNQTIAASERSSVTLDTTRGLAAQVPTTRFA